jgi:predicted MFS family arabinose efflux permease
MIKKGYAYAQKLPKDLLLFIIAIALTGFAQSIVDSTFNNFLNESFNLSNFQRTILEMPREAPGILVVFLAALLFFLCNRSLAAVANLFAGAGLLLIAFFSGHFSVMLIWLFIFSIGQHLFLPLTSDIGMELAKGGKTGKRLGQLNAVANITAIAGSAFIFVGFKYLHFNFRFSFIIAAASYIAAAWIIDKMKRNKPSSTKARLILRKEYSFYYWLCIFFGTRKQIFITFAPWVMVTIFQQKTQTIAILLTIGGVIGIFFKPLLGRAIDALGERTILIMEAVTLMIVCLAYAFAKQFFPIQIAIVIIYACYIIDQLAMSVNMARATYLKKIAKNADEVSSTLMTGLSLDHMFSILVAVGCGYLWLKFDYHYIFLVGAFIAFVNLIAVLKYMKKQSKSAEIALIPQID